LRPLKIDELHSVTELRKREIFNGLIERRWGTSINPPIVSVVSDTGNSSDEFEDEDEAARIVPDIDGTVDAKGKLLNQQPAYVKILHSEQVSPVVTPNPESPSCQYNNEAQFVVCTS
jgi:hypothetical protein